MSLMSEMKGFRTLLTSLHRELHIVSVMLIQVCFNGFGFFSDFNELT